MQFSVEYSDESLLQLELIDKINVKRIMKKIDNARLNPNHFFERLTSRPEYKLRVGDYRIIADVDKTKNIIFIRTVGHRKNIYKKL